MAAVLILAAAVLLLAAVLVSPREPSRSERRGLVTDCQRDPLRPYGSPKHPRHSTPPD